MSDDKDSTTVPAQVIVPIDTIVDLTLARIQQRKMASFRWGIIALIGLATLLIAVFEFERQRLEAAGAEERLRLQNTIQDTLQEEERARAPNRLGYLRDADLFTDLHSAAVGRTPVALGVDEVARFALQIDQSGMYRIEAIAEEQDLDPLLYLYQLRLSETAVDAIDFNDDFNGFNSRIDTALEADRTYYVEIQELGGDPGPIALMLEQTDN